MCARIRREWVVISVNLVHSCRWRVSKAAGGFSVALSPVLPDCLFLGRCSLPCTVIVESQMNFQRSAAEASFSKSKLLSVVEIQNWQSELLELLLPQFSYETWFCLATLGSLRRVCVVVVAVCPFAVCSCPQCVRLVLRSSTRLRMSDRERERLRCKQTRVCTLQCNIGLLYYHALRKLPVMYLQIIVHALVNKACCVGPTESTCYSPLISGLSCLSTTYCRIPRR